MASKYWIKLYHEILDDPKMGMMPEILFSRCIKIFLVAGEFDEGGYLPDVEKMAWRMRINAEQLESDLIELQKLHIVEFRAGKWFVSKFQERQEAMKPAEKMKRNRGEKQKSQYYQSVTSGVTECVTNSNADTDTDEDKDTEEGKIQAAPAAHLTPYPTNAREASENKEIQMFRNISGVFPGIDDYKAVIDTIVFLRSTYSHEDELRSYLLPFWLAWDSRKTKDGLPFKKTNPTWLTEWAVSNDIPPVSEDKSRQTKPNTPALVDYSELRLAAMGDA